MKFIVRERNSWWKGKKHSGHLGHIFLAEQEGQKNAGLIAPIHASAAYTGFIFNSKEKGEEAIRSFCGWNTNFQPTDFEILEVGDEITMSDLRMGKIK